MSFRNERFMQKFLSLDLIKQGDNSEKRDFLSDGGRGAQAVRDYLDLKEGQTEKELEPEERQKRVREKLDKMRETILNANLADIKPGAKKEKKQKEALVKLFDLMRETGANREETILRLSMTLNLKRHSAKRFYDRGVGMLKVLFTLKK